VPFILMFLAVARYADQEARKRLMWAVVASGVAVSLWGLHASTTTTTRIGGTLGNANFFAAYLLVPVFVALALKPRWISLSAVVVMVTAILVSQSTGALVALVVGAAVMAFRAGYKSPVLVAAIAGMAMIPLALSEPDGNKCAVNEYPLLAYLPVSLHAGRSALSQMSQKTKTGL